LSNGSWLGSARWRTTRPGSPLSSKASTTAVKAMGIANGKGGVWLTNSTRLSVPAKSSTGSGATLREARYG